jgi:monothiol glutaredoxin
MQDVNANPVMLYMKGVPAAPQCGFSNRVVRVLEAYGVDFESANVLADEDLRVSIKDFSDWPTIPQLYVNGEFVGGCDIIMAMHEADELNDLFDSAKQS